MKKEFKKFNLENLSNKQVDFYNFVINNLDDILELSIKEISEKYGCGISFIYTFLASLNVHGWKTFIFLLGIQRGINNAVKINKAFNKEENLKNKITNLVFNNNKITDFENKLILDEQYLKLDKMCDDIINAKKIIGFGQGHGLLAVNDLFGMFSKLELKCTQLIKNKSNFKQIIEEIEDEDLFIFYSFKGVSEFTITLFNLIKETKPNVKTYLVTSNYNCKVPELSNRTIFIHNNLMEIEIKGEIILASPLRSFIIFNDFLKTLLYYKNKKEFSNLKLLITELNSWKDNNNDYYRSEKNVLKKDEKKS
ncbi:MurR/RpiR family transcriptional regulator [Spiroplasma alleghenense]|uniref:MurR/RpiR family transcriptional regulator n=1 Tax=Spiroplasma alleghenense TaxID=216931 RepID=A0A345Z308_9MOLU|nr:MurR/RpiR family transcriptional regulator [Spiroplasma alleghenense]AXK50987.1 MurR/RpiR family transcriptional regulator [Spiroplasma alleghenense]